MAAFVGIGQRTAADHMVKTEMIHTGCIRLKTKTDLTQGMQITQHCIQHHNEMRVPVEVLYVAI